MRLVCYVGLNGRFRFNGRIRIKGMCTVYDQ